MLPSSGFTPPREPITNGEFDASRGIDTSQVIAKLRDAAAAQSATASMLKDDDPRRELLAKGALEAHQAAEILEYQRNSPSVVQQMNRDDIQPPFQGLVNLAPESVIQMVRPKETMRNALVRHAQDVTASSLNISQNPEARIAPFAFIAPPGILDLKILATTGLGKVSTVI